MTMPEKPLPPAMAVAIAYLAEATIPKVVAKGRGTLAEAIIARGKEAGVYVHESRELVSLPSSRVARTSYRPAATG